MSDQPRINELLEAYRPGIDDLADDAWGPLRAALADNPEVQRCNQTIQRRDQVVRSAMHKVAVPAGLAERLLASLPEGDSTSVLATAPPQASEPVSLPPVAATSGRFSRRAWAAAVISTAAAITLAIALWPSSPPGHGNVTADELARMVMDWENDGSLATNWRSISSPGLSSYPIRENDVTAQPVGVIGPESRDDVSLVVYDLQSASGKQARLYVAYTGCNFTVPTTPLALLRGLTGGRQAIAWQQDEFLYVVVVDSGEAMPQEFVRIRDYT